MSATQSINFSASALPVAGNFIKSADVNATLQALINDYNLTIGNNKLAAGAVMATNVKAEAFTAWTPTVYQSDGSTTLTATVRFARYIQYGKFVVGQVDIDTIGNPVGASIHVSLPVNGKGDTTYNVYIGSAWTNSNGTLDVGYAFLNNLASATQAVVKLRGDGNWATSGSNACIFNFWYEAA